MRYWKGIIFVLVFVSCQREDYNSVSHLQVFQEMWTFVDEHYVYFDYKNVDWNAVKLDYQSKITDDLSDEEFFAICLEMLNELRDGHNRLSGPYDFRENYNYQEGYDIYFNDTLIREKYLDDDFEVAGNYTFGLLDDNIGYVHFSKFRGVGNISKVMEFMNDKSIEGLVFDVRDNSGGSGQNVVEIVGHFIETETTVGYIYEKIGPAHDDFSEALSIKAKPKTPFFDIPVMLLTNRNSYSATSYLAGQMSTLDNITHIGQITGGGGGGNTTYELPNGWLVTVSTNKFQDANFREIEDGVIPDIVIENDQNILLNGVDQMLERALDEF